MSCSSAGVVWFMSHIHRYTTFPKVLFLDLLHLLSDSAVGSWAHVSDSRHTPLFWMLIADYHDLVMVEHWLAANLLPQNMLG